MTSVTIFGHSICNCYTPLGCVGFYVVVAVIKYMDSLK